MSNLVHHFFNVKGGATKTTVPSEPKTVMPSVHIAVQGCCHGMLDQIYAACATHERETGKKISFLICCGDFQAVRDTQDLKSMAVSEKYKVLGDFAAYYRQEKKAPYLTIFIGGNHENSDWLANESYGGYLAPNIYYMGHSSVVIVDEFITIAGLSGIFKAHDYKQPYPRRPFYTSEACKRSAYHVRKIEVEKLTAFAQSLDTIRGNAESQVTNGESSVGSSLNCAASFPEIDIFLSHDWPVGITKYGDEAQLLRYKPYFEDDIRHNALGNPHTMSLLRVARPRHWLAAHLHCYFEATVHHQDSENPDKMATNKVTNFLALDKCSKQTGFLDFIDVPVKGHNTVSDSKEGEVQGRIVYHPLWLEVLRDTHTHLQENAPTWTASSCGLLKFPPNQLAKLSTWLPANNTQSVLHALGLQPLPLQQPFTQGNIMVRPTPVHRATHDRTISPRTEVVEKFNNTLEETGWTEDTNGLT